MTFVAKDWRDANPDGTGDTSTPTNAAAFEDLERRVGGAAGGNSLLAQGCVGNGVVDDEPAFQAALDAFRSNGVWVEGEARTYQVTKPLVLPPFVKLRQMNIRAAPSFAPVDPNGAVIMCSQGGATTFTAAAATNVFTTAVAHNLPVNGNDADGLGVVVKGFTGGGVVPGRVYYVRERTPTTYKLGASRVFGRGTLVNGSNEITDLAVEGGSGTWTTGMSISGTGLLFGTTITTLGPSPGQAFMSANATQDGLRGLKGVSTAIDVTSDIAGTAYHEVLSLGKMYMEDVLVDGGLIAGINGAALSIQQQSELYKFRVNRCPGVGLMLNGQQSVFIDFQGTTCGTSLALEGASYMNFYAPNMEACNKAIHLLPGHQVFPSQWGGQVNSFLGLHIEMNNGSGYATSTSTAIDLEGPHSEMVFDTCTISMNIVGQRVFHVHTGDSVTSGYDIRSFKCNTGGLQRPIFMQDDDRGHLTDSLGDVTFHQGELKATPKPNAPTFTDPGSREILLPEGGYLRQGSQHPTQAPFQSKAPSNLTAPQAVWRDSSDVDKLSIAADGKLTASTFKLSGGAGISRVLMSDADGDASWQALPVGTEVVALPPFQAGRYTFASAGSPGNTTPGADEIGRATFMPIMWTVDRERSIDRMGVLITTAGGAGSVVRFGLYADNGTMVPGALIADFGTVATTTTGFKEVTAVATMLPGIYWVGVVAQVAAPQWQRTVPGTWGQLMTQPAQTTVGVWATGSGVVLAGLPDPAAPAGSLFLPPPATMVRTA